MRVRSSPAARSGVGDDEHGVDRKAALTDRLDEALDEDGRLPRPGTRRDEDDARLLDGGELLGAGNGLGHLRRGRRHERRTRHIVQRSHHCGHSPPARVVTDVAGTDPRHGSHRVPAGRVHPLPELVRLEVVVVLEARHGVVARVFAQEPARLARAREAAVDPAERLDPDEVAKREDVERDLQPQLGFDVARAVRPTELVVLNDPTGAQRVEVDAVDLARDAEVAQLEPALELDRRTARSERNLEAPRDEREAERDVLADEVLEIAASVCSSSSRVVSGTSRRTPPAIASARHSRRKTIASSRCSSSSVSIPSRLGRPL